MNRFEMMLGDEVLRVPRVSGDEPGNVRNRTTDPESSPRKRG